VAKPVLSQSARPATFDVAAFDEYGERRTVSIAGEIPLTVYLDRQEILTLMTLGAAPEALVLGYLRNQRLLTSIEQIASVQVDWDTGACAVTTHQAVDLADKLKKRTRTTGCGEGTVFGDLMADVDNIHLRTDVSLKQSTLYSLLSTVRQHESIYKQSGAVHGCALLKDEQLLYFVEDVGRHNAVDAIAGYMWLDGVSGDDKIFYTTGRLTSEMVIKAAQMQVPFLVSRSGITQMGFQLAQQLNMTLIARATNKHFLLFAGSERLIKDVTLDAKLT
jgi:FdhD protein